MLVINLKKNQIQ